MVAVRRPRAPSRAVRALQRTQRLRRRLTAVRRRAGPGKCRCLGACADADDAVTAGWTRPGSLPGSGAVELEWVTFPRKRLVKNFTGRDGWTPGFPGGGAWEVRDISRCLSRPARG